jgi:hypothetical protein
MKPVKNFLLATLFVSAVTFNTYAGDLDTPGYVPPPPPPNHSMVASGNENPTDSDLNSLSAEYASEASDKLFYDALMAMLSLF